MLPAVARAENTVYRQIHKYKVAVALTRPGTATVSAAGGVTRGTASTDSTIGTFLPLSEYTDNREEQRTLAHRGVRYLLMAARGMTLEPRPHDVLTIGSDSWDVESSTPVMGATVAIAHQALVVKL
jgi:hypothetical protein